MQNAQIIRTSIIALGLSFASTCFGAAINIASSATETKNNSSSATQNVPSDPGWSAAFAGSSWISNVQSGNGNVAGWTAVSNGTSVTFTDTFNINNINGTPLSGSLDVMADDMVSVSLNGIALTPTALNSSNSSNFVIRWTSDTAGVFNLASALKSGQNTLSFTVTQTAAGAFGLDYAGTVNYTSATPEPGTLALLGLPLAALGFLRIRKAKA